MHAYIYARRRRNLATLRIMTINFFGFSNAAFIFFTFSHLLYFTFSHLLDFTYSHLLDNSIIGFYIFTSFGFLYSSLFPSEFPSLTLHYSEKDRLIILFSILQEELPWVISADVEEN